MKIVRWKTLKIENLRIALKELYPEGTTIGPELIDPLRKEILIEGLCEICEIRGTWEEGGFILINTILIFGEGSEEFLKTFKKALVSSTGILEAFQIWDNGVVDELKSNNGNISFRTMEF